MHGPVQGPAHVSQVLQSCCNATRFMQLEQTLGGCVNAALLSHQVLGAVLQEGHWAGCCSHGALVTIILGVTAEQVRGQQGLITCIDSGAVVMIVEIDTCARRAGVGMVQGIERSQGQPLIVRAGDLVDGAQKDRVYPELRSQLIGDVCLVTVGWRCRTGGKVGLSSWWTTRCRG